MRMQNQAKLSAGAHRGHMANEQASVLICDSYARCSLRAAAIWGGYFAPREQSPQIFG